LTRAEEKISSLEELLQNVVASDKKTEGGQYQEDEPRKEPSPASRMRLYQE